MSERYCSVEESLRESLQQIQKIKSGEIPKKTWSEFVEESVENNSSVLESIKEGFEEIELYKQGKIDLKTLEESKEQWEGWIYEE